MHNRLLVTIASLATLLLLDSATRAQSPDDKANQQTPAQTTPAQASSTQASPTEASTSESATTDSQSPARVQYAPKSGQKCSYEFEIAIRGADETTFYKGTTHYTVDEVTDQQIRLTYRGGLHESTKMHESRKPGTIPYLGKQGENVRLRRNDGKEITVPLARLSADDQRYVATFLKKPND